MTDKKQCRKCSEWKTFIFFNATKTGLTSYCKGCASLASKESAARLEALSPGYSAAMTRAWRARNPGSHAASKKKYREANPEKNRAYVAAATAKFKLENPEEYAAKTGEKAMRREAAQIQRTPAWSETEACRTAYRLRVALQKSTGVKHAVDHSVPLRGKLVSGLHVPENLSVIPFEENAQKSNKFDPMTYEWWPECCPKPLQKAMFSRQESQILT